MSPDDQGEQMLNASEHVTKRADGGFTGRCPDCAYRTGPHSKADTTEVALSSHWRAKHGAAEEAVVEGEVVGAEVELKRPALLAVEDDERTALERIEDLVFEAQMRRLMKQHRWAELQAAFLLYGSTLSDRYGETVEAGTDV